MRLQQYLEGMKRFAAVIDEFAAAHQLEGRAKVDHVCVRCGVPAMFDMTMVEMEPVSLFIHQTRIGGKRNAYFALKPEAAIMTHLGWVRFMELSDKPADDPRRAPFHHVEIYPTGIEYAKLIELLSSRGVTFELDERPHHVTHDHVLPDGRFARFTQVPLIDKIVGEIPELVKKGIPGSIKSH